MPRLSMRISRTPSKKRVQQSPVFKSIADRPRDEIVWWFGGLLKGAPGRQPRVQVWLRGLEGDVLTDEYRAIQVPLSEISTFAIGSIWSKGASQQSAARETCVFGVDFDPDGWECLALTEASQLEATIPSATYPLFTSFRHHTPYLLRFNADFGTKGVSLLVPCMEFFSRMYGHSSAVRRILASEPWLDARAKLLRPLPRVPAVGAWAVNLQQRCVNADVVFLAHLEYDEYAQRQLKLLWSQLEASSSRPDNTEHAIRVFPWWRGRATLGVKGVWLDDGATFLGLRIVGASQPPGEPIERGRESPTGSGTPGGDAADGGPQGPKRVRSDAAMRIVDMTDDLPPDHEGDDLIIHDEHLQVLGQPREVSSLRYPGTSDQAMTYVPRQGYGSSSLYSSDATMGTGKGVGSATFVTPQDFDSMGTLREVWMYLNALTRLHPDFVRSVAYLQKDGRFVESPEPELLPFQPFTDRELAQHSVDNRTWPYLVADSKVLRGALTARVCTSRGDVYLFEIQRRLAQVDGGSSVEAENFRGLVFTHSQPEQVGTWVRRLMLSIRFSLGRGLNNVPDPPSGMARAFNHSPASSERFLQEAAIRNAFGLVDVPLPVVDPKVPRTASRRPPGR